MNKIKGDIELDILTSLLLKPELMNEIKVEDKHFIKHKRLWLFMKSFYNKFKTFDIELMYAVCKDKYQILSSIEMLLESEPKFESFDKYQDLLIAQYTQKQHDKWLILKICELSDKLYLGDENVSEYAQKVANLYKQADDIFKKERK